MANPIKSEYYRWNGSSWDLFYFRTSADMVVTNSTYQFISQDEKDLLNAYLTEFNKRNKLVKLDDVAKIPATLIPSLNYLPLTGGSITGNLNVSGQIQSHTGEISTITTNTITAPTMQQGLGVLTIKGTNIDFYGGVLKNLGSPVEGTDAATKEFVENLMATGFNPRLPVKAASIENINIATTLNVLDGYTLSAGDRVLLKDQTNASQNGVYVLNSSKIPQKVAEDSNQGCAVFVENGTTNNDHIFYLNKDGDWVIFSKPDTIKAGSGLTKSGTTISIQDGGVTNEMLAGNIHWNKIGTSGSISSVTSWTSMSDFNLNLQTAINYLASAIKNLRGTSLWRTDNTQTIAGAYTAISNLENVQIKTGYGANLPTTGNKTGDLFFVTVS